MFEIVESHWQVLDQTNVWLFCKYKKIANNLMKKAMQKSSLTSIGFEYFYKK